MGGKAHDQRRGDGMETVPVVIPTSNEERSIGKVIDSVPLADLLKYRIETAVYVIDGHSADNKGCSLNEITLPHRGNPDQLPCSRGSAQVVVSDRRPENRRVSVYEIRALHKRLGWKRTRYS